MSTAAKYSLFWINQDRKHVSFKRLQVNEDDVEDKDDNFSLLHLLLLVVVVVIVVVVYNWVYNFIIQIYLKKTNYNSCFENIIGDSRYWFISNFLSGSWSELPTPVEASANSTKELDSILEKLLGLGPEVCAWFLGMLQYL